MTLFILEHKYRLSDKDGVKQGCTILGGKATRPMLVAAIVVKGEVRNVRVQLGEETLKIEPGTTALEPPRKVEIGQPLAIDFEGDGSVELAAERETVNKPKAAAV